MVRRIALVSAAEIAAGVEDETMNVQGIRVPVMKCLSAGRKAEVRETWENMLARCPHNDAHYLTGQNVPPSAGDHGTPEEWEQAVKVAKWAHWRADSLGIDLRGVNDVVVEETGKPKVKHPARERDIVVRVGNKDKSKWTVIFSVLGHETPEADPDWFVVCEVYVPAWEEKKAVRTRTRRTRLPGI